ncbi:hypothetical protein CDEST_07264 [Colletotrichum destructivum]|uniref:Uncharacterized protein n=1 Tax=Colletotrichum destructivum TaxID=34406 RepID=A0AAX4IFZ4_9PEZI|nr:hypothetical protein CDEST_07264 [Colletotrichum destructivum]
MKFFATLLAVAPLATSVMSRAVDTLDTRQNSCIGSTYPVLSVNHVDRKEIQGEIDHRGSLGWIATPDVSVIFDFGATTPANPRLNFQILNKNSVTWKAVILSNYVDTITTPARETVRISIDAARQVGADSIPTFLDGCVQLPRLDGTWYVQMES